MNWDFPIRKGWKKLKGEFVPVTDKKVLARLRKSWEKEQKKIVVRKMTKWIIERP